MIAIVKRLTIIYLLQGGRSLPSLIPEWRASLALQGKLCNSWTDCVTPGPMVDARETATIPDEAAGVPVRSIRHRPFIICV